IKREEIQKSDSCFAKIGILIASIIESKIMIVPGCDDRNLGAELFELGDFSLQAVLITNRPVFRFAGINSVSHGNVQIVFHFPHRGPYGLRFLLMTAGAESNLLWCLVRTQRGNS